LENTSGRKNASTGEIPSYTGKKNSYTWKKPMYIKKNEQNDIIKKRKQKNKM
jgi:hypothetical protein